MPSTAPNPKSRRKKPDDDIAVLVSGGLDSSVLLADLAQRFTRVHPIYIKKGLLWEDAELYWLKQFIKAIRPKALQSERPGREGSDPSRGSSVEKIAVLKLPVQDLYGSHWSLTGRDVPDYESGDPSVYLPGRNLILLAKAAVFCALNRIGTLALGPLKGNPFPDSSRSFFRSFQDCASQALQTRLSILAPYLDLSKAEVLKKGRNFPLELTLSCIQPAGIYHCGICNKCAERQRAFEKAGIADRTVYRRGRPRRT